MSELPLEERIKMLEEENNNLRKKNEDFKNLEEELAAKKIFELAYERMKRLVTLGGVITILVGVIGYNTIINKADAVISKLDSTAILKTATAEIDKNILPKLHEELLAEGKNQIKKFTDSITLSAPKKVTQESFKENSIEILKADSAVKTYIDLSKNMNPVRNEGDEGSVVGFSLASALEYIIWKQRNERIIISPRFIYNNIKGGLGDNGAQIKDGMKFLYTVGAIEEKYWPYIAGQFNSVPPKDAETAYHYKIKDYSKLDISLENFKNALASNLPIVVGITVTDVDMTEAVGKTGIFPPFNSKNTVVGGHAICIVGYDDHTKRIKFRNCWGKDWGDNGYGYLSYEDIKSNIMDDAWIIKNVFNPGVGLRKGIT